MTNFPRMHVSLYVSDLDNTISFYNTFFGKDPEKVEPGYTKYILDEPSLIISFIENKDRVSQNFGHLGFQVDSEETLNVKLWEAKKHNLVALEEKGTNCCYAKQDKFWVTDPDGVQWEVYYFHEDVKFNDPKYESESGEASACCSPSNKKKVNLAEVPSDKVCC